MKGKQIEEQLNAVGVGLGEGVGSYDGPVAGFGLGAGPGFYDGPAGCGIGTGPSIGIGKTLRYIGITAVCSAPFLYMLYLEFGVKYVILAVLLLFAVKASSFISNRIESWLTHRFIIKVLGMHTKSSSISDIDKVKEKLCKEAVEKMEDKKKEVPDDQKD